jgi:hypothetical protein
MSRARLVHGNGCVGGRGAAATGSKDATRRPRGRTASVPVRYIPPRGPGRARGGVNPGSGRCPHRGFACKNRSRRGLEEAATGSKDATRRRRGRTASVPGRLIPPRGPEEADDEGRAPCLAD